MGQIFGWVGSLCFAFCGLPQAAKAIRDGNAVGLSPVFLALWASGEVFYIAATLMELGWVWWLLANYAVNLGCLAVIIFYWVVPRQGVLL